MPEKRMLIVPAELVRKIDENRGDMSQGDFIEFLIDSQISDKAKTPAETKRFATKDELRFFEEDIKQLLKSFLDFFVSYGLELGKQSPQSELEELTSKLHELEGGLGAEVKKEEIKEGKIKWK
jgi:hypothetical protein